MAEDGWLQGAEGSPTRTEYAVKEALHPACAEGLKEQVTAGIGQSQPRKEATLPPSPLCSCVRTTEFSLKSMGKGEQNLKYPDCVKFEVTEKPLNVIIIPRRLLD